MTTLNSTLRWLATSALFALTFLRNSSAAWAQEACSVAVANGRAAWLAKNCDAMRVSSQNLHQLMVGDCQGNAELTSTLNNLTSSLRAGCLCQSLSAAIEQAKASAQTQLSCETALKRVAQLRYYGSCKDEQVLAAARKTETGLEPQLQRCAPVCDELPNRIKAAESGGEKPETLADLRAQCYGCPKDIIGACSPAPAPGGGTAGKQQHCDFATDTQTLTALRRDLEDQNQSLRTDATCRTKGACTDRETLRLEKLTSYLELLHGAKLCEATRQSETSLARDLLRALSFDADDMTVILNFSAEELRSLATMRSVAASPRVRKVLLHQLNQLGTNQYKDLILALDKSGSLVELMRAASRLDADQRQILFHIAGTGMDESRIRDASLQQLQESQFEVVLPELSDGECTGHDEFWGTLKAQLSKAQPPTWVHRPDGRATFEHRIRERERACAGKAPGERTRGCGAVLLVEPQKLTPVHMVVGAQLAFLVPTKSGVHVRRETLTKVEFDMTEAGLRTQQDAASALATTVAFAFDRLRSLPTLESISLWPATHCGVTITEGATSLTRPQGRPELFANGDCGSPEFRKALEESLTLYGVAENLGTSQTWTAKDDTSGKCTLTVQAPVGNVKVEMFSVSALVNPATSCDGETSAEKKWTNGGQEAARRIARYMVSLPRTKKPPPYWHAFYFSGARQLEHTNGRSGWGWAAAETGLLVSAAVFTGLAVHARNQVDPRSGSTSKADRYLGLAYGSLGLVIPLRAVAGALFNEETAEETAARTRDLTQSYR